MKALVFKFRFETMAIALSTVKVLSVLSIMWLPIQACYAGKFSSKYPCQDTGKRCVSSGARTVDGYVVHKDCWEWSYGKTCNYPSKNNCSQYVHCYLVGFRECLLSDSVGNCVNQLKEYSCKRWAPSSIPIEKIRYGREEKQGINNIRCKGLPCIDGNCIDKSYDSNNEIMDSVSKLYAVSQMKGVVNMLMELFAGYSASCTKKAVGYSNCCKLDGGSNNWGHNLGAQCTKDEQTLIETRKKNLCVYVGKENKQTLGMSILVKHHWCCFGNMLNKVIQVEGRKQLGLAFGTPSSPDCRGLTLEQLLKLDWNKMNFSEFEIEIMKKMKIPESKDLEARIKNSMPNVQTSPGERIASSNRRDGINNNTVDDSWEAEEEKRFTDENIRQVQAEEERRRAEHERLVEEQRQVELRRQAEETRLAQIRAQEEEKQRLIRQAEAKRQRKALIEKELSDAKSKFIVAQNESISSEKPFSQGIGYFLTPGNSPAHIEFHRAKKAYLEAAKRFRELENKLKSGNY
jgi:conjugal transfer mating pair stabilization protein TraN